MKTERDAKLLGYAGLLPFAFGAIIAWMPGVPISLRTSCLEWTLLYAAIILSFMGGARWGVAMMADGRRSGAPFSGFLAAVTPALAAWAMVVPEALLPFASPASVRFAVLIAAFAGLLAEDLRAVRAGEAPDWYGRLRVRLTLGVVVALALVIVRLVTG